MIAARKYAGITNMSNYANKKCQNTLYVNEVTGTKHKLLVAVGNDAAGYAGETGYTKILSGYHYAYFLSNDAETSWTDVPSGSYEEGFKTTPSQSARQRELNWFIPWTALPLLQRAQL